jgi:hypothetical protein
MIVQTHQPRTLIAIHFSSNLLPMGRGRKIVEG